jgi:lipopolysaccharide assembly outer membrane protein LptD (OstA)
MKPLLCLLASLLLFAGVSQAQFGSFGDVPIDITSDNSRMEAGLAIAEGNVVIQYGTTTIYCDYAQYNPETRDVLVRGNVRIYREGRLFTGERALYNLETKILHAADFSGDFAPFRFGGETLGTLGSNAYLVKDGLFTTSDNSKPDYYLKARTVRIYPHDRIIFRDVMLYVGRTPIFWFPYIYQSLNKEQGFTLTPGYNSVWGAYLLGTYTFPLTEHISAKLRLDLLSERGIGVGLESRWGSDESEKNWGRFRSYYIDDSDPGENRTSLAREPIDPSRYRLSFQNRTYLTENLYASIDVNKLSDARFLQDFDPGEFRRNPNPDNMIGLTLWDEDFAGTLIARKNLNEEHFDMTERLPEGAFDMKRQPFFRTQLFYESETSAGFYRRNFAGDGAIDDYDTFRADTFHQLTLPKTLFGWLSVIPRVGVRGTYYAESGTFEDRIQSHIVESTVPGEPARVDTTTVRELHEHGSLFRPVFNAGLESSFKISRAWEQAQSRMWGVDGLRHIMQPFVNFSYVYSDEDPINVLQFDRLNRSTQLPPVDFPQFNTIDSIDNWTILRLGIRNRLQTRRDNRTINWFELNTYFDINFDRPEFLGGEMPDPGTFSNVFNRLRWTPLSWVNLTIDSQLPLLDSGFTEINSRLNFLVNRNVELNLGHRYLDGNPIIADSNLVQFGGYFRFDDNWAFSFRESYEFADSVLESQRYELHRDLSSWVASLGFVIHDNRGVNDYGLLLTFTLKDLPNARLPVTFDPEDLGGAGSGKNR